MWRVPLGYLSGARAFDSYELCVIIHVLRCNLRMRDAFLFFGCLVLSDAASQIPGQKAYLEHWCHMKHAEYAFIL